MHLFEWFSALPKQKWWYIKWITWRRYKEEQPSFLSHSILWSVSKTLILFDSDYFHYPHYGMSSFEMDSYVRLLVLASVFIPIQPILNVAESYGSSPLKTFRTHIPIEIKSKHSKTKKTQPELTFLLLGLSHPSTFSFMCHSCQPCYFHKES